MNSISGDNPEKTLGRILKSLKHILDDQAQEYLKLAATTSKNNIKKLLIEFAEEARQDSIKIDEIINSKEANLTVSDEGFSILSDIDVPYKDLDDEEKLIFNAIRTSEELQSLYKIVLNEYNSKMITGVFSILIRHENFHKNELGRLYEEIIAKGEW